MLFHSIEYIALFLPLVLFLTIVLVRSGRSQLVFPFLLISSIVFYSYWKLIYLPLILSSVTLNYLFAKRIVQIEHEAAKKRVLALGILTALGPLIYFKYSSFVLTNINHLLDTQLPISDFILPLAISFYTFQQIAFLVDAYKGEVQDFHFLDYCLFVLFFPQLIAGPIVHHKELIPQLSKLRRSAEIKVGYGDAFTLFSIGLCKKIVSPQFLCVTPPG